MLCLQLKGNRRLILIDEEGRQTVLLNRESRPVRVGIEARPGLRVLREELLRGEGSQDGDKAA